jgi:hypothetical protein
MCDYSLHGLETRLAKEGEVLIVHRFHTGSKGFTSPEFLKPSKQPKKGLVAMFTRMLTPMMLTFPAQPRVCAVCIPDGARLMLHGVSATLQRGHSLSDTELLTFRQLSANSGTYRDAVEFKNGVTLSLQSLQEGQSVEVVALSLENTGVQEGMLLAADAQFPARA